MIRKAVITTAGRGTRFFPVTRAVPKEMLPIISKPLVHYAVAEAVASGISDIIFITSPGKATLKEYFNANLNPDDKLGEEAEKKLLNEIRAIFRVAKFSFVLQELPLGLGHAVLTAREMVGNEPFAVMLPDDVIMARTPVLKQMISIHEKYGSSVLAVETIKPQDSVKYGVIDAEPLTSKIYRIKGLVEKPVPSAAPSSLGIVGRYILNPEIFEQLAKTPPGLKNEIQLTDALRQLLIRQTIYAFEFEGTRYDAGTPMGLLKANLSFALKDRAMSGELKAYMKSILKY